MNDEDFMRAALVLAREAEQADEVPVGAVVVLDGEAGTIPPPMPRCWRCATLLKI
jgi:tRNA(Arg) A34 adenosine deaminase TadA